MVSNKQNQSGRAVAAPCGGGLLGWLTGLLGSSTPTYAGSGQPAATGGWGFFGGTPTYKVAPPEPVPEPVPATPCECEPKDDAPAETLDGELLRPIAIIVRREPSASREGDDGRGADDVAG